MRQRPTTGTHRVIPDRADLGTTERASTRQMIAFS
jgi:hypothetical protein